MLEVLDGIYTAADDKQVGVIIELNPYAAFDTVQHDVLLKRLCDEFRVVPVDNLYRRQRAVRVSQSAVVVNRADHI